MFGSTESFISFVFSCLLPAISQTVGHAVDSHAHYSLQNEDNNKDFNQKCCPPVEQTALPNYKTLPKGDHLVEKMIKRALSHKTKPTWKPNEELESNNRDRRQYDANNYYNGNSKLPPFLDNWYINSDPQAGPPVHTKELPEWFLGNSPEKERFSKEYLNRQRVPQCLSNKLLLDILQLKDSASYREKPNSRYYSTEYAVDQAKEPDFRRNDESTNPFQQWFFNRMQPTWSIYDYEQPPHKPKKHTSPQKPSDLIPPEHRTHNQCTGSDCFKSAQEVLVVKPLNETTIININLLSDTPQRPNTNIKIIIDPNDDTTKVKKTQNVYRHKEPAHNPIKSIPMNDVFKFLFDFLGQSRNTSEETGENFILPAAMDADFDRLPPFQKFATPPNNFSTVPTGMKNATSELSDDSMTAPPNRKDMNLDEKNFTTIIANEATPTSCENGDEKRICVSVGDELVTQPQDHRIFQIDSKLFKCTGSTIQTEKCDDNLLIEISKPCARFSMADGVVCLGQNALLICNPKSQCVCTGGIDSVMMGRARHQDFCRPTWYPHQKCTAAPTIN